MSIDPAIAALLSQADPPPPKELPVAERRRAVERGFAEMDDNFPHGPEFDRVDITETSVVGPERDIPVRIFTPSDAQGDLPAMLYFFGGAWWMRTYDSPDMIRSCRQIASEAQVVVVEIDYALAPEHPYPAALREGLAVLQWMAADAGELGIDSTRLAVGGISSGGNLAASLALLCRDEGVPPIALQVLEVPATDLSHAEFEARLTAGAPEGAAAGVREALEFYLPTGLVPGDYLASPAAAADFSGLPAALILTADNDALKHSGQAYADKLRDAGVDVVAVNYGGQVHGTPGLAGISAGARAWRRQVSWAVSTLHSQGGPFGW